MSNARFESLRETGWRRPLTEAEQSELRVWLEAHPETQADWEAETGLNAALGTLPDVPMPSNFTAQVLQEVGRAAVAGGRTRVSAWPEFDLRRWLPRLAVGAMAAGALLASVQFYQAANRASVGASVLALSEVTPAPSADYLADFDSIRKLTPAPGADTELLSLLQ